MQFPLSQGWILNVQFWLGSFESVEIRMEIQLHTALPDPLVPEFSLSWKKILCPLIESLFILFIDNKLLSMKIVGPLISAVVGFN